MNQPIVKSQRIDVVDALRGFAVLAILLVVFATINAAFFPAGDVLLLFAIVAWCCSLPETLATRWCSYLLPHRASSCARQRVHGESPYRNCSYCVAD